MQRGAAFGSALFEYAGNRIPGPARRFRTRE
jgi:hypothetical protein